VRKTSLRRHGALATVVLLGAACAASSAAAYDVCALAQADSYAEASRVLEAGGCSVSSEDGTSKRSFRCPAEGWANVTNSYSGFSVVIPGGSEDLGASCGGEPWAPAAVAYDNPLIAEIRTLGASYNEKARLTLFAFDNDAPLFMWLCRGSSCRYGYDDDLRDILARYLGAGVTKFSSSDIRIAGLDITKARQADLDRELSARGGARTDDFKPGLLTSASYVGISGVPGLGRVDVTYLKDRIAYVRYAIRDQAAYTTFSQALDQRYGDSHPMPDKGCVDRLWTSGGVSVIGEFCSADAEKSGFLFINTGAADITSAINKLLSSTETPSKATPPPKPKARTDMY